MNPNSWVILRSLMSRPAFQALVARMILWVQSSNHTRPTFISLDTPAASAKRAARFGQGTHLPPAHASMKWPRPPDLRKRSRTPGRARGLCQSQPQVANGWQHLHFQLYDSALFAKAMRPLKRPSPRVQQKLFPKVLEPIRCQFGVADRVLDVLVA